MIKRAILTVILLIILQLPLCLTPKSKATPTTTIMVDPPVVTGLEIGDTFTVNITVTDVTDLYAWQIPLYYKSSVLNATKITPEPQWQDPSGFSYIINFTDTYNATHGFILMTGSLLGMVSGLSGKVLLASITFKILAYGSSPLYLDPVGEPPDYNIHTKLLDSTTPFGKLINHTINQGTVNIGLIDIAIINTHLSKTYTNDTTVFINVTVTNEGEAAAQFSITAYIDANPIETKTNINLPPGVTTHLVFTLDTAPIPKGVYTISITAIPVPGEMDPTDNTFTDGTITETIKGDVNGDFKVSIEDVFEFAKAFNRTPGHPKWNPNCDLNNDGKISIEDVFALAKNYGKKSDNSFLSS